MPEDKDEHVQQQARQQTGQQQVTLTVDDRNMRSGYANAFRTNATAEEVILDFGLNIAGPQQQTGKPEIIFTINERVIMNYYSAKRLAITLSQVIRRHEDQFGTLELDVAKRQKGTA